MDFLPVCLHIAHKNILLVGGGKVAFKKACLLQRYSTNITVLATDFIAEFKNHSFRLIQKNYQKTDLKNFMNHFKHIPKYLHVLAKGIITQSMLNQFQIKSKIINYG